MLFARQNLKGLHYAVGTDYAANGSWKIIEPNSAVCNEIIARAYRGDGKYTGFSDFPVEMSNQARWFDQHGWLTRDKNAGHVGDVIFFGDVTASGKRHAVLITEIRIGADGTTQYRIISAHHGEERDDQGNVIQEERVSDESKDYYTIDRLSGREFNKRFYGIGSIDSPPAALDFDYESNERGYEAYYAAPPDHTHPGAGS
jgi:hypothetical protein